MRKMLTIVFLTIFALSAAPLAADSTVHARQAHHHHHHHRHAHHG